MVDVQLSNAKLVERLQNVADATGLNMAEAKRFCCPTTACARHVAAHTD